MTATTLSLIQNLKSVLEDSLQIPIYYLAITDLEAIDDLYGEKGGILFWEGYSSPERDDYWNVLHYEMHEFTLMVYRSFGGNPRDKKIQDRIIAYFSDINKKLGLLTGTVLEEFKEYTYSPLFLAGQSSIYFPELLGNKKSQNYVASSFTLIYGIIRET